MVYSESFPHSPITQQMADRLPSWMKAREPESHTQQLLNPVALELEAIDEAVARLLDNLFIRSARLESVDWIHKAVLPEPIDDEDPPDIVGYQNGQAQAIDRVWRLRDFLESDEHVYIVDAERSLIYFRQRYDSVTWDGQSLELDDHHIWNPFDELALWAGLRRHHLETNEQLKLRIQYAFRALPTVNRLGVAAAVANFCGLIAEEIWPEGSGHTLQQPKVLAHTVRINDRPVLAGQLNGTSLAAVVTPLGMDAPVRQDGVVIEDGRLKLAKQALQGEWISPLLDPGNLERWTKATFQAGGNVRIDVLPYTFFHDRNPQPILKDIQSGDAWPGHDLDLQGPIYLRVLLSRRRPSDPSPWLADVEVFYDHTEAVVHYLYGAESNALHDEAFKRTFFDERGHPLPQMRQIVDELNAAIPVLWDFFRWDEAFWDIIEDDLVGLDVLPTRWDGTLEGIPESRLQPGIGFGPDLEPRQDGWGLMTHRGFYYQGRHLDNHYLFAKPHVETKTTPVNTITLPAGVPGTPYVVLATRLGETVALTQVCFLDASLEPSIENTETLVGNGTSVLYATYGHLDIDQLVIETPGYSLDAGRYSGDNRIPLNETVPEGQEVKVRYRIKDSFVAKATDQGVVLMLSETYDQATAMAETGDWRKHDVSFDPVATHWRTGFAFIADREEDPARIRARATPSALVVDGFSRAVVVADVLDRYDNPVYGVAPTVTVSGKDEGGQALVDPGQVVPVDASGNRYVYRYLPPASIPSHAVITLTFTCGTVEDTATLRLRKVETS